MKTLRKLFKLNACQFQRESVVSLAKKLLERPGLFNVQSSEDEHTVEAGAINIKYHSELVPQLVHDHKYLIEIMTLMITLLEEKQFEEVMKNVILLKYELNRHVLTENHRFYAYLSKCSIDSVRFGKARMTTKEVKESMQMLMKDVNRFFSYVSSKSFELNNASYDNFRLRCNKIVTSLGRRIFMEEQYLYPQYRDYS